MSNLPYCPNCRHDLPKKVEGWICLQARDLARTDSTDWEEDKQGRTLHRREADPCGTYVSSGDQCSACQKPRKEKFSRPACPSCREGLPYFGGCVPRTITITGPLGAGKSHYIVALHEWWSQCLGEFGISALPVMSQPVEKEFAKMRSYVLQHGRRLPATRLGEVISFSWLFMAGRAESSGVLLTLPDTSGEVLMNHRHLAASRHFDHSSAVIFLVDGARLVDGHPVEGRRHDHSHIKLADAMIQDFSARMVATERQNIPVAVCVNKLDLLCGLDARWNDIALNFVPLHQGHFDFETCEARSRQIRLLLETNSEMAAVANRLETNFVHVMYFAMATLGSDSEVVCFKPMGVEDPFLYHLAHQQQWGHGALQ